MNNTAWNQGLEQPRKGRECFSPGQDLKEEDKRVGKSAIARLVTPKPYQYKRDTKGPDPAIMREDTTLDEDKVKKKHVQQHCTMRCGLGPPSQGCKIRTRCAYLRTPVVFVSPFPSFYYFCVSSFPFCVSYAHRFVLF